MEFGHVLMSRRTTMKELTAVVCAQILLSFANGLSQCQDSAEKCERFELDSLSDGRMRVIWFNFVLSR